MADTAGMGLIHVDSSQLPLLHVRFKGAVDDKAFDQYLGEMLANLSRNNRYVLLVDALEAGMAPPPQRRRQAEFLKQHQAALARNCVGCAFVIAQPMIRGVLTAILWIQEMPFEHIVVGSLGEAEVWCRERMIRERLTAKK